jgi:apolipoprotein N-acyltransferase
VKPSALASGALAALGSGLLLAASFLRPGWGMLAWVALVPLWWAIDGERPARAFRLGWLAGAAFFLVAFDWVPGTILRAAAPGATAALFPLILLAAVLGLTFGFFAAGLRFFEFRTGRDGLALAVALWVALEWCRSRPFVPCPWQLLGYTQVAVLRLVQASDVTGIYGVSGLVVAVNGALASACARRRGWRLRLAAVAGLWLATYAYGAIRLGQVRADRAETTVRVGLVQPSIDPAQKWDARLREQAIDLQEHLAREAVVNGADLVVWPEASAPYVFASDHFYEGDPSRFAEDRRLRDRMTAFVKDLGVPLLFGAPSLVAQPLGRGEAWGSLNRSLLLGPEGAVAAHYDKMILVPFGEYVPARRLLFFVGKLVPGVGDFVAGTEATLFPLGRARFAVLVCYEALFSDFVRRFVDRGAALLVNQTNDAWFGAAGAPYEHLAEASVRAIENRVPLVRVANTGVSAVVMPDGTIVGRMPLGERGVTIVGIRLGKSVPTFYTRHGDVFAQAASLAAILMLLYAAWRTSQPAPALVGAA